MRRHRIHVPDPLEAGSEIELDGDRSHYLARVLRLQAEDQVFVFDGQGNEFAARITAATRAHVLLRLEQREENACESPLAITLVQAISRGERMDHTLQKATELGVTAIRPLVTRRTEVKLAGRRLDKRMDHWRGVIIAACEQCGRAVVPEITLPVTIADLQQESPPELALLLSPAADRRLGDLTPPGASVTLAAGPEGGFSEDEEAAIRDAGWQPISLGPRILRTETAGPAAIALAQGLWGDL